MSKNKKSAPRPFDFVTGFIPENYGEVVFYTTKPQGSAAHLGADIHVPHAEVHWLHDEEDRKIAVIAGIDDLGREIAARTCVTDNGDDQVLNLVVGGKELLAR